jgi:peptide/nickel transport system permease protein
VPWILTGLPLAALMLRLTRTAVVGVMGEDYIRAAEGKGLTRARVMRRHALPAAAAPVIAATGMTVNLTITNVILMETVFGIPGVFGRMRGAIGYGDFPMLMGITIVGSVLIAVSNLLADLALAWLDPRSR